MRRIGNERQQGGIFVSNKNNQSKPNAKSSKGNPGRGGNLRRVVFLVEFAVLLAIEAIVCFTPLGSVPMPGGMVATLSTVPVVVAALVLGTGAGAAMGLFFGLFSFLVWTFMPPNPLFAFVFTPAYNGGNFWSLAICFVPRILAGVVAAASFRGLSALLGRHKNLELVGYALSGILGSLTNTVLVVGGIFVFFGPSYAKALGKAYDLLLGILGLTVVTNGLIEAALAAVAAVAVCYPLRKYVKKY